ncbi:MAG: 4Fe-4S binding protein, partial [Dehalococcoidia bacterium]
MPALRQAGQQLAPGVDGQAADTPEERVDYPDAFRGMPVLVQLDNGQPKCVACGLCEFACPTDCISIVPGELEGSRIERYPEAFDIDMSRCM